MQLMKEYTVRVYENGAILWLMNGLLHCEHGPAIIDPDGTKKWYRDGELHREDGPAVENPTGIIAYWFQGKRYSFPTWKKLVLKSQVKELSVAEIEQLLGYKVKVVDK